MEEKINELKLEKQKMLEIANSEKRDLTDEEKKRGFQIDQEIYQLQNNQNINPTDILKTSVKIDMGSAPHQVKEENNEPVQVEAPVTAELVQAETPVIAEPAQVEPPVVA